MQRIRTDYWDGVLRDMVMAHARHAKSRHAESLLREWDLRIGKFWQVVPKDPIAIGALEAPLTPDEEERKLA